MNARSPPSRSSEMLLDLPISLEMASSPLRHLLSSTSPKTWAFLKSINAHARGDWLSCSDNLRFRTAPNPPPALGSAGLCHKLGSTFRVGQFHRNLTLNSAVLSMPPSTLQTPRSAWHCSLQVLCPSGPKGALETPWKIHDPPPMNL